MSDIGGFFELELPRHEGRSYHPHALALNNGRSCFDLILERAQPASVWVPFYSCDALLAPLIARRIPFKFYPIDENLEPSPLPDLGDDEYFLFVNYFGLKSERAAQLSERYPGRLIFDDSQAFFRRGNDQVWSFNSARKFFGVPDGAFLYGPNLGGVCLERNREIRTKHLVSRLLGMQQRAYQEFLEAESQQSIAPKRLSVFSEALLGTIDFDEVARKRRANFLQFDSVFSKMNRFPFSLGQSEVPLCYPLLLERKIDTRRLASRGIYLARYWPDVLERALPCGDDKNHALERSLVDRLVPLPIDHRYDFDECERVSSELLNEL